MIDDYFQSIAATIANSPIIHSHNIRFDKRGPTEGYVRGDIYFTDDSRLHFREFVSPDAEVERFIYVYHYQRADGALVFRCDNAAHHLHLDNAPHHKHDGDEANVLSAQAPDLASVLKEIEAHLPPPPTISSSAG